jgi:Ca2+-binding RTX toxin-like protein
MATATAKYSVSFSTIDFSTLLLADDTTTKSNLFVVDHGDIEERFTGKNLSYDWAGLPKSGTITGYQTVSDDDGTVLTVTGLSISAKHLANAAKSVLDIDDDGDLVASMFSGADTITGSRYVDELKGFAGKDVMNGGRGSDVLTGGAGSDHFVFTKGSGTDVITDFKASGGAAAHDLIDLSGYEGVDNFADLSIHKVDGVVVVDFGSDEVVLQDVKLAAIDKTDFIF